MLNGTLYRAGLKSISKIIVIFFAVLALYMTIIISMFDPQIGKTMNDLLESMPDLMAMFGMNGPSDNLVLFLSNYLYGFIMLVFPMIYSILAANQLVARHIEKGSMAYLLASPNKRSTVIATQLAVQCTGLLLLIICSATVGAVMAEAMFPGALDLALFVRLNIGLLLLQLAIAGISFFAACISNDTRLSLGIGAGVPIAFYLLQMLSNMGGKLEALKYFTLFSLFNINQILLEHRYLIAYAALALIAAALYFSSIRLFDQRDLSL